MVSFSECFSQKSGSDDVPEKYELHDIFHHSGKSNVCHTSQLLAHEPVVDDGSAAGLWRHAEQ